MEVIFNLFLVIFGKKIIQIWRKKWKSDPFSALIESIISQQISSKAAETVRKRVYAVLDGEMTPSKIVEVGFENITKKEFEDYRKLFSPYCSIASLYFWELSK